MSSIHSKRLANQPPPNYVPGLGRGASGFTTRSDIGPGRFDESPPVPTAAQIAEARIEQQEGDYSDAQFDQWGGYSENLFGGGVYEADDEEADRVYGHVDTLMENRRKRHREEKEAKDVSEFRKTRPKIQQMFSDLKKGLAAVDVGQWATLPEIGDTTIKKHKKQQIWTPVPDSVITGGGDGGGSHTTLSSKQTHWGGMATPEGATPVTDLRAFGQSKNTVLTVKLAQVSDSVQGQTVVDPQGYLTNLNHQQTHSDAEIGDLKRARLLLKSVTSTNPTHGPGWIAAARVEEIAGRLAAARNIIGQGCKACPTAQDVWLEGIRLANATQAKEILADALENIPHSVKLWSKAAALEDKNLKKKRAIYRKALEIIPNSVRLWQEAVELEDREEARLLLSKAVTCVNNVDLWLALAKLETYKNAKAVINKARHANPTEPQIWIAAAELEECQKNYETVKSIIERAVKSMSGNQITREQWIQYAEGAEGAEHPITCKDIIEAAIGLDLEDSDKKHTWIADAEKCIANGSKGTARAIYGHALTVFPHKKGIWLRAAHLAKQDGNTEEVDSLLKQAVQHCPKAEILWLMAAKESWIAKKIAQARTILGEAFRQNPNSEQIWLAAVKLESEEKETERARVLLQKARAQACTARIWMKSAKLERQTENYQTEFEILEEAVNKFRIEPGTHYGVSPPVVGKLWLMLLQWQQRQTVQDQQRDEHLPEQEKALRDKKRFESIRNWYTKAYKSCAECLHIWIAAAEIEEQVCKDMVKARSIIEKARLRNGAHPLLWTASIRMERRSGNKKLALTQLAKGLQEFSTSGDIWALAIDLEAAASKRNKSIQAIKKCDKDSAVICSVAKLFWSDRKFDKTRSWFNRAVALDPDYGDAWAHFYRFEVQHGDEDRQRDIIQRVEEAEPHHGYLWTTVTKHPANCTVGGCKLTLTEVVKKVAEKIDMSTYNMG